MCALSDCTVPGLCFHIWPDDGSFELKHVAEFLILITIHIVVLVTGINYCIIAIHNGMAHIKGTSVVAADIIAPCDSGKQLNGYVFPLSTIRKPTAQHPLNKRRLSGCVLIHNMSRDSGTVSQIITTRLFHPEYVPCAHHYI